MRFFVRWFILLAVTGFVVAGIQFLSLDGVIGALGGLFLREDTVYAAGYSDRDFRRIEAGMTVAEVESFLGKPLEIRAGGRNNPGGRCWSYSESPSNTNYRKRLVYFNDDGRVTRKESWYYLD